MKDMRMLCVLCFILVITTGCIQNKEVLGRTEKRTFWEELTTVKEISSEDESVMIPDRYFVQSTDYTKEELDEDYLEKLGINFAYLERMKRLGLSFREMKAAYGNLKTREDKEFFIDLLNERYRTAFQIDPKRLSVETKIFLTEYTRFLFDYKKVEELQQLINEILYTDEAYSYYPNHYAGHAYGTEYIQLLCDTTNCLMEETGKILLSPKSLTEDNRREKLDDYMRELASLNVLWESIRRTAFGSEYFHESGIKDESMLLLYGSKLVSLKLQGGGLFEYNMMYSTAFIKDSQLEIAGDNVGEIEWRKDCLLEVSTYINKNSHSICDAPPFYIIRDSLLDDFNMRKRLDNEIANLKAQKKLEWFGATSSFQAGSLKETVNGGYYNATALEYLRDWEENGLSSMLERKLEGYKGVENLADNLKSQLIADRKYTDAASTLIEGGDILGLDAEELVNAVWDMNKAYQYFYLVIDEDHGLIVDGPCGTHLDLEGIFQMSIPKK